MAKRTKGAERLRARLVQLEMNQVELCERIGADPSQVSRWLSGERAPSLKYASRLLAELGIPIDAWVEGSRTGTDG